MTEKLTQQSMYSRSKEIGIRLDDVILQPAERYGDTETRILQLDEQSLYLVPEHVELVHSRHEGKKSIYSDLDLEMNKGLKFRVKLRDKLGATAVPATYAAMEALTNSVTIGSASAGIGFGGYLLYLAKQGHNNRREYLHQLGADLKQLREKVMSDRETVRIRNQAEVMYFLNSQSNELLDSIVTPSGINDHELPARDILSWYEQKMSHVKLRILCFQHGEDTTIDSEYSERQPFLRVEKLLSSVFEEGDLDGGIELHKIRTPKERKKFFRENTEQIVTTLTAKNNASPSEAIEQEQVALVECDTCDEELDPTLTLIYLPPGKVIESLLTTDQNPGEFWKLILEEAVKLHGLTNSIYEAKEKIAFIDRRAKHAGIENPEDKQELDNLRKIISESEQACIKSTLSILATAAIRDRTLRYNAVREELIASLGDTAKAGDQYSAIQLFGAGIDALAMSIDPDSEEAIETSKELKEYLLGAVPYIDGTKNAYDQLFEGMALSFPQLKLH